MKNKYLDYGNLATFFEKDESVPPRQLASIPLGDLEKPINLELSFASKKAIEVLEKLGGKIKLTKK